ncbi:hypothetical protein PV328_009552 [Microctonus aethiopoides]|uniref:Uncharacterized protein n=1 Tax=Microctonus aethiopoides TaxID=144406 RepID=A0AA39C6L3_9HYME|nr:hypothetical protein PV328_009552 [Microctonus aethiopoides]
MLAFFIMVPSVSGGPGSKAEQGSRDFTADYIVGRPVLPHSSLSRELAATQNRLTSIYGFSSRATLQGPEPTWTHVSGENIDTEQPERNYVHQKKQKLSKVH